MKFLLDTNTVSFAIRGVGRVGERLLEKEPGDIAVSSLTASELWFGVEKVGSRTLERAVSDFLAALTCRAFDSAAARQYGKLRAQLEKRGAPIGNADTLIAAHAQTLGLVLVTNNKKHFGRVKGLTCEDWV
jgi:tRNA(fMet)-specific endonuclease VapC